MYYNKILFGTTPTACREVWNILYKHIYNTRGSSYTFHVRIPMIDPDTGEERIFLNWASQYNMDLIKFALKNVNPKPPNRIEICDVVKEKSW